MYRSFSGIFPHLAVTNDLPTECGIGAVVNYGGRLYWITYPASGPKGGGAKLYSIDDSMDLVIHPESVGGTHANRMIHPATGKLIIGCYVIDTDGGIKSYDVARLFGRITGSGVSLTDPQQWAYLNTMEDGLYEVNVDTMEVRRLRRDIIWDLQKRETRLATAPQKMYGDHAKGGYTAQGVFILSNNAHKGVLAEWDGKSDAQNPQNWKVIDRNKYTEITGPGGIAGPTSEHDPVWALGWDDKSVLLNVRNDGKWTRLRLPKASYTQDADHGWYTEWPRIREIGNGHYLMCMHGMFYDFPAQFTPMQKNGIRPLCRHLKMISDWADFKGVLAFACDDATPFDNPLLGQQQSNLWFASYEDIRSLSEPLGFGGLYAHENVFCNEVSEPFFVGGFSNKVVHISNGDDIDIDFRIEHDPDGWGTWITLTTVSVPHNSYKQVLLPAECGEWVRVVPERDATSSSVFFHLRMDRNIPVDGKLAKGLRTASDKRAFYGGKVYPAKGADLKLQYFAEKSEDGRTVCLGMYEIGKELEMKTAEIPEERPNLDAKAFYEPQVRDTGHSYALIDRDGTVYHVAKNESCYDMLDTRIVRETVTERSMINLGGTFFELPRPSSGGVRRMKPVTTHHRRITDFCSWRGMLVLTGVDTESESEHILRAPDGTGLWLGNIDDLWRLGSPSGKGGPIKDGFLYCSQASEPFLTMGYRKIRAVFSHNLKENVRFAIDVDYMADGTYGEWGAVNAVPGDQTEYVFPEGFSAHWIRIRPDKDCICTVEFMLE